MSFFLTPYECLCLHTTAITLISSLRDGQGDDEPENHPEASAVHFDHYPSQSQRIVLLAQNQWRRSEKSSKADMTSHKTPHQMLSEASMLSGSSNCFFDGYTGTKPLIGEGRSRIEIVGSTVRNV